MDEKGTRDPFSLHEGVPFSVSLWASTSHTPFPCLYLSFVSVTLRLCFSVCVCLSFSVSPPLSLSISLSPPPHPHPFVCHQDSTLVTTGAKAGKQVCEGEEEGRGRGCVRPTGPHTPHLHRTLIFFGSPSPFPANPPP